MKDRPTKTLAEALLAEMLSTIVLTTGTGAAMKAASSSSAGPKRPSMVAFGATSSAAVVFAFSATAEGTTTGAILAGGVLASAVKLLWGKACNAAL